MLAHKTYRYRLYPNKEQEQKFLWTLDRCRELYNAALQERREAWRMCRVSVNFASQSAQLPGMKGIRDEYRDIYGQVLIDVLHRVDTNMQAFFRRCKSGVNPGYPRFKGKGRYNSFTYPQMSYKGHGGFSLKEKHVHLPKIGDVRVKLHRPIEGKIKTCTIKREGEQWYVYFSCEVDIPVLPANNEMVGIDLGLLHFAALSNGEVIENPRYYRNGEAKLQKAHRHLDRCKRGSHRRAKAKKQVSKHYRKIKNQRRDFLHKTSHHLVNNYGSIFLEDLALANMSKAPEPKRDESGKYLHNGASQKGGLNKSIHDAGWGIFQEYVSYKAEWAGRQVILVDPKYTSQICSGCGQVRKKELSERWHSCDCGCELDRDHNAAINILRLGRSQQRAIPVKASGENRGTSQGVSYAILSV